MELDRAVSALAALAHPGRLAVFRLLVGAGLTGLPAGEIARALNQPANTLSAQLSILAGAEMVHARRQGRSIIYTAALSRLVALLGFLMEDCCGGAPEMCRPVLEALASPCALHAPAP